MEKIHIEICEPEGNAFWLLGLANELAIKAGRDPRPILRRMKSRDYRHLLNVLQREFGELLVLTDRGVVIPRPTGSRRQAPSGQR